MCTLSWTTSGASLEVFFNRDERLTRGPEIAPAIVRGSVSFLAPRDSDQGGTWVGVNDHGLVAGLLNGYHPSDLAQADARSRGELVVAALGSRDACSAIEAIRRLELTRFRSFVLALLRPEDAPTVLRWDRDSLRVESGDAVRAPLISSSVAGVEVDARRRSVFDALDRPWTSESLTDAHRSHEHGPSAYSVCMHRDDGATRSFTRIAVGANRVRLAWSAGSPCKAIAPVVVELPRVGT